MLVTLLGIVISVSFLHLSKAESSIRVTLLGIVYITPDLLAGYLISVVRAMLNNTPSKTKNEVFAATTVIEVRLPQFPKAL